jgi:hypothetical protein
MTLDPQQTVIRVAAPVTDDDECEHEALSNRVRRTGRIPTRGHGTLGSTADPDNLPKICRKMIRAGLRIFPEPCSDLQLYRRDDRI